MLQISSEQRRQLKARAHGLNPVVSISQQGLSDSVLKEIDVCLKAHELIKIRVYGDDREARAAYLEAICNQLEAAPVQHIGKLLVVWRPARRGGAPGSPSAAHPAPDPSYQAQLSVINQRPPLRPRRSSRPRASRLWSR
ncbi:YhbY family RNA-binding protein [Azovibrio restrictus]|uniref:YhbY family RNA-binding protein n=1 Tax=Azovibrio restrictus TaxID=146938 RepID=UPI0026ED6CA5|nr:YhbY family RNA-binding protein [Azovibrio restrictus]